MKDIRYIVGIDEAGRGPLAGPVSVGVICIPIKFPRQFFKGIKDSKALSSHQREEWFKKIKAQKKLGLVYTVSFRTAGRIDKKGIIVSIKECIQSALIRLNISPKHSLILLDGGLKAPSEFRFQKTIIRGDVKKPVIALASIVAKVLRDRKMIRYAKLYPKYFFDIHKGYGTKLHRKLIKKHGPSFLHRKSFLKIV